jgi:hypothetical protein
MFNATNRESLITGKYPTLVYTYDFKVLNLPCQIVKDCQEEGKICQNWRVPHPAFKEKYRNTVPLKF